MGEISCQSCSLCNKDGYFLLPARIELVRGNNIDFDPYSFFSELPKIERFWEYSLGYLRSGYIYIYNESKKKIKAFQSDHLGILKQIDYTGINSDFYNGLSESCLKDSKKLGSSLLIDIQESEIDDDIWVGYSPMKMTSKVLNQVFKNDLYKKYMSKVTFGGGNSITFNAENYYNIFKKEKIYNYSSFSKYQNNFKTMYFSEVESEVKLGDFKHENIFFKKNIVMGLDRRYESIESKINSDYSKLLIIPLMDIVGLMMDISVGKNFEINLLNEINEQELFTVAATNHIEKYVKNIYVKTYEEKVTREAQSYVTKNHYPQVYSKNEHKIDELPAINKELYLKEIKERFEKINYNDLYQNSILYWNEEYKSQYNGENFNNFEKKYQDDLKRLNNNEISFFEKLFLKLYDSFYLNFFFNGMLDEDDNVQKFNFFEYYLISLGSMTDCKKVIDKIVFDIESEIQGKLIYKALTFNDAFTAEHLAEGILNVYNLISSIEEVLPPEAENALKDTYKLMAGVIMPIYLKIIDKFQKNGHKNLAVKLLSFFSDLDIKIVTIEGKVDSFFYRASRELLDIGKSNFNEPNFVADKLGDFENYLDDLYEELESKGKYNSRLYRQLKSVKKEKLRKTDNNLIKIKVILAEPKSSESYGNVLNNTEVFSDWLNDKKNDLVKSNTSFFADCHVLFSTAINVYNFLNAYEEFNKSNIHASDYEQLHKELYESAVAVLSSVFEVAELATKRNILKLSTSASLKTASYLSVAARYFNIAGNAISAILYSRDLTNAVNNSESGLVICLHITKVTLGIVLVVLAFFAAATVAWAGLLIVLVIFALDYAIKIKSHNNLQNWLKSAKFGIGNIKFDSTYQLKEEFDKLFSRDSESLVVDQISWNKL